MRETKNFLFSCNDPKAQIQLPIHVIATRLTMPRGRHNIRILKFFQTILDHNFIISLVKSLLEIFSTEKIMNEHIRLFLNFKFCVYLLALCTYKERQNEEKEKEKERRKKERK